jgi:hypothetical protein
MKAMRTLGAVPTIATVGVTLLLSASARACDDSPHGLGDHPAVVVQRLYKAPGYDYASKFYPHPAGLRLYAQPPRDAVDGERATGRLAATEPPLAERAIAREATAPPNADLRGGGSN